MMPTDTLRSILDRLRLIAGDMCGSNRFYLNEEIGRLDVAIKSFVPPIQTIPLHPELKNGESTEVLTVKQAKKRRWRKQ